MNVRHYFNKITTPTKRSQWRTFTQVRLGCNVEFAKEIGMGTDTLMGWWYTDNNCQLYRKSLDDAPNITSVEFLAYSGPFCRKETICDYVNNYLENNCRSLVGRIGVQLGLLKKNVYPFNLDVVKGEKGFMNNPAMVIQFETDVPYVYRVKKQLYLIFNMIEGLLIHN